MPWNRRQCRACSLRSHGPSGPRMERAAGGTGPHGSPAGSAQEGAKWALLLSICEDKDAAAALTGGRLVNNLQSLALGPQRRTCLRVARFWDSDWARVLQGRVLFLKSQVQKCVLHSHSHLGTGPFTEWGAWGVSGLFVFPPSSLIFSSTLFSLLFLLLNIRQDTEAQVWVQWWAERPLKPHFTTTLHMASHDPELIYRNFRDHRRGDSKAEFSICEASFPNTPEHVQVRLMGLPLAQTETIWALKS